ncbi:hypothetical protein [Companilactobacillus kimchiensis]|uniref:Cell surface protein n=1 Tax=Companilactobacillus kimchiensis TaxID=993692 RepID=A0A0R2LC45_9LACO|nr:hypothetical protein [Companilactobacillus kimchiensis]KRN99195.1 cell surface protein precursor [Companilactobacillus kimchiensis]
MNNAYKCIKYFLSIFLIALFCFVLFNNDTLNVKAVSEQDVIDQTNRHIDDGVKDWSQKTSNLGYIGSIPISNGVSLDYTFGSARNRTGKVVGGDSTITNPTVSTTAGTNYFSKINVFINNHGKYNSIVHQGKNSYNDNGDPGKTSDTSADFDLAQGLLNQYYGSYSVMGKMSSKVFLIGHDDKQRLVLKIAGHLDSGPGTGTYAEVVLRPSATGAPIVQRELYVYNPSTSTKQYQTYFGEDTSLNDDSTIYDSTTSSNPEDNGDDVPLYAIGGGQGLYITSDKNATSSKAKLFVTNNVPGGFNDFMGIAYSSPYNITIKGKSNTPGSGDIRNPSLTQGKNDTGDTKRNAGSSLLYGSNDNGTVFPVVDRNGHSNSAYTLRWSSLGQDANSVAHYASTIGATISPYAVPTVSKTYTNSNKSTDGLNHVGDTLHFTLKVSNQGLNSNWSFNNLVDKLPAGLQIDQNSAKYVWTYMTSPSSNTSTSEDTEHIGGRGDVPLTATTNNQLNFTPNTILKDKSTYTVTFDATVTFNSLNNLNNGVLNNTATFTGNNRNSNGSNLDNNKDYTDNVDIPIETPKFRPTFTKQIRNVSKGGVFADNATGEKGDIIEYQAQLKNIGTDTLKSGTFSDDLPAGIELVPGTVKLNNVIQNGLSFNVGAYPNNNIPLTVDFQAKVTSPKAMTATNIAELNNVKTAANTPYKNIESSSAILAITETAPTISFDEVPSLIDFGSINTDGSEKLLPSVRTDGKLLITHTDNTPFQVTVSYNNEDSPISTKNANGTIANKLMQNNDDVIYFNQNTNNDLANWQPISASGIPIKIDGFSGSYTSGDFSKYIGLDKWKLLIPSNTKAGKYNGLVTWGISDTPQ